MLQSVLFPIKVYAGAIALSPFTVVSEKLSFAGYLSDLAYRGLSAALSKALPEGPISDKNVQWISTLANQATFSSPVKAFQSLPAKYSLFLSWLEYPATAIGLNARKVFTFVNQRSLAEEQKAKTVNAIITAAISGAKFPIPKEKGMSDVENQRTVLTSFKGKVLKILTAQVSNTPSLAQAASFGLVMGAYCTAAWLARYYFINSIVTDNSIFYYPAALACVNIFAAMRLRFSTRSEYNEALKTRNIATVLTKEMVTAIKAAAGDDFQLVDESDNTLKAEFAEKMGEFATLLGQLDKIIEAKVKPKTPQKATARGKTPGAETPAPKKSAEGNKTAESKETKDDKKVPASNSKTEPPATPKKTPAAQKRSAATPATESTKKSASLAIKVPKYEDLTEKVIRGWKSGISSKIDMGELNTGNALSFLKEHLKAVKKHKESAIDVEDEDLENALEVLRKYIANEIKRTEDSIRRASISNKNKAMQNFAVAPAKSSWSFSDLLNCCRGSKKAAAPAKDEDESVVVKKAATPKRPVAKKAEMQPVVEDEEEGLVTPGNSDNELEVEEQEDGAPQELDHTETFLRDAAEMISDDELVNGGLDSDKKE